MHRCRRLLFLVPLLLAGSAHADFTIDFHLGNSVKPPTRLEISQAGYEDVEISNVRYETRPWLPNTNLANFTQNYYDLRVGYYPFGADARTIDLGFELELLHDKAYYESGDDPDDVVQHFELSDGVNYLLINAVGRYPIGITDQFPHGRAQVLVRAGMGVVVTAPASTIRGQSLGHDLHGTYRGYDLAGPGFQVAAQARQFILPWLAISTEGKYTYSSPKQYIAGGTARTYLPTLHLNVGLSFVPGW
ncbi:MAG TPA: hypothetical protein VF168_13950 [Trueperaceae bacterium]